ncbi:MAG: S49 family peptidase [Gammaproteobacteria bacterium]|nr:MAG: S49 family peptidase [Gammaproteobacteria bacterium]
MPDWNEVLREIQDHKLESPLDAVRRQYLNKLSEKTDRNVIAYYSGWLNAARPSPVFVINDEDKNAFMATIHKLERNKGLDLILHTPGGDLAAAESLVDYLRQMFGTNIRAIVPQLAMSAGTMIACACKKIIMGKQSNLGPIDPQFNGVPANGVIAEFNQAIEEIKKDPATIPLWQSIIGKYHPSFLGSCQHAILWSKQIVAEWLRTGMFDGEDAEEKIRKIIEGLSDSETTYNHARHIHVEKLEKLGLRIEKMEEDDDLQDLVLTVHHTYMHTFAMSPALKIVENHRGEAMIRMGEKPQ